MLENSLQAGQHLQGNPLESHLRTFVTSLLEDGYADATVHDKLSSLDRLGQWLRRTGLAVTHLDERLVRAFVKHRQRVQRGDLKNAPAVSRLSPRVWLVPRSRAGS